MKEAHQKDNTEIISRVKKWVNEFVIGLKLCPFARGPFENNQVRFQVCNSEQLEEWIHFFIDQCNELSTSSNEELATVLLIFPNGLENFHKFLDIEETFQEMLRESGFNDLIQLATFHPNYQFDDTELDDVTNYTNKSPLPIIQLLRVDEVTKAINGHRNTSEIPTTNKNLMKHLGKELIRSKYLVN